MWTERLLVALLLTFTSLDARAQGCCAFGSSLTPTRLDLHERALVGLQIGVSGLHGSHTASGKYRPTPESSTDIELRQTLFATAAIGSRVQLSALAPWVETYRHTASSGGDVGHGLGDVSALVRVDVVQLKEYTDVPALAFLAGGSFPTGTAAEDALSPLGSDTTGSGVYRGSVGLAVEQSFGAWIANVTATVAFAAPATRAGIRTQHAPRFTSLAGAGYAWSHHLSTALAFSFEAEGNTRVNSMEANRSNKLRTELALIGTYGFDDDWRVQARLSAEPPLSHLGVNEPARLGGSLAVIWSAL